MAPEARAARSEAPPSPVRSSSARCDNAPLPQFSEGVPTLPGDHAQGAGGLPAEVLLAGLHGYGDSRRHRWKVRAGANFHRLAPGHDAARARPRKHPRTHARSGGEVGKRVSGLVADKTAAKPGEI